MTTSHSRLRTLDLAYIALFAVLIAISAWISIPFPVPFTLQTFAIILALMTLGGKRGFYAVLVYLLMGAAGLPVFSGFQGGFGMFMGGYRRISHRISCKCVFLPHHHKQA